MDKPFPIIKYALQFGYVIRVHYVMNNKIRRRYILPIPWESYGIVEVVYQCPMIIVPSREDVKKHHDALIHILVDTCKDHGIFVST